MKKKSLKELQRISIEEFKQRQRHPIVIVLDNVRSALNVGSAFRTADAFACEQIYLCGITAQPPHREILKTAIGATASVPWKYFPHSKEALTELKTKGYTILGIEQIHDSISLADFTFQKQKPYALVFGNEVEGISDEILPLLDEAIEIPQFGTKHSLNISVCVGILCWEAVR
ncbi:MAG TPA: TrmH family RNA methyltransferase [Phaeodactylibacter sp.]|nr:TrmH family RNA methyltransferase [Phaeodactylibacter sp.]